MSKPCVVNFVINSLSDRQPKDFAAIYVKQELYKRDIGGYIL